MDVHAKLAEIRRAVEQARSMPMSASAVVNRQELLDQLDDLKEGLGAALSDADRVLRERDDVVEQGRQEAERLLAEAHEEQQRLVSDTELFRMAQREADRVRAEAQAEAQGLQKETDDYVDGKLANFEITLERTTEAVKRGRERLAGRTALDALAEDDVDAIRLPRHLDR